MGGYNGRPQGTRTTTDATICNPVVCTAPLSGRVGGEKHEQCHEKRVRNQRGSSIKATALLEPTIMSTRKICDRKQQVVCPQKNSA